MDKALARHFPGASQAQKKSSQNSGKKAGQVLGLAAIHV